MASRGGPTRARETVLVKLGGSLITDKETAATARPEVIRRLAREIERALPWLPGGLVLGHGSGSFGHVTAVATGVHRGLGESCGAPGIAATQAAAAELHRVVLDALRRAGVPAFSVAPSTAVVTEEGRPVVFQAEPVALALEAGLVPVLYGDVVLDRGQGVAILSTEEVLAGVAARLPDFGWRAVRALWMGVTEGVYGPGGRTLSRVDPTAAADALAAAGGSDGPDVTGGMAHRLEVAVRLARRGVPSQIADGRVPGLLERALRGEEVPGTRVLPGPPAAT